MNDEREERNTPALVFTGDDGEARTTSMALAEGTERDHATVIRLVRDNLADLEDFGLLDFKSESTGGRPTEVAHLNEQQATLLLTYMRNNPAVRLFKKALVKAFYEMRAALQQRDPMAALNDPEAMRGLLLTYSERVIALEEQNEALKPQVEAYERIAVADGSMCVTDAAKHLQVRPKDLFDYLKSHGWIYKRAGAKSYVGYQSKTQQGLLEHKVTTVLAADGSERITEQVRVTPKGLSKLALLFRPDVRAA
jgi:phage regulator Rha-like protein/phage antirepressor YoqD-like protein